MKQTHKLSDLQKLEIIELFKNGLNFPAIAKMYSVTPRSIKLILNKNSHYAKYRGKIPPEKRDEIVELYKTGNYFIKDLAEKFGVSSTAMRTMLRKTGNFAPSANIIHTKYDVNCDYFEKIDTPNKSYILGLLYADGCISEESNRLLLSLQDKDKHLLESIKIELGSDKPLYYRPIKTTINKNGIAINSHGHNVLVVTNQKVISDLMRHGVLPRKSLNLSWPTTVPDNLMIDFIRGFFDGDGGLSSKGSVSFMANIEFITQLKKYLQDTVGCPDNIIYKHSRSNVYYYTFSGKIDVLHFYVWIYPDGCELFLKRKKDLFIKIMKNRANII